MGTKDQATTRADKQMSADQSVTTRRRLSLGSLVIRVLPLFVFSATLVFCILVFSPLGTFRVEIAVDSSESGTSQMFFATGASDFSGNRSQSQRVVVGLNRLAFVGNPIRGTVGSSLRWDPLDKPATIEIKSFEVSAFLLREKFDPVEVLRPSLDVSEVAADANGASIQTLSNDGQVIVDIDVDSLYQGHFLAVIAMSLIAGLVASLVGTWVWLTGRSLRLTFESTGVVWRVFVVVLGAAVAISVSWALVAR